MSTVNGATANAERKRLQLRRAATANLMKMDDELLCAFTAFSDHAVTTQPRQLAMTVTDDQGRKLFDTNVRVQGGDTLGSKNHTTTPEGEQFSSQNTAIQFRMSNLSRIDQDELSQAQFIAQLDAKLTPVNYPLCKRANRLDSLRRLNLDLLRKAEILLVTDSYGNSHAQQLYTTPNVAMTALPGASFEAVATSADLLAAHYMDSASAVIILASANDYLTAHKRAVSDARMRNTAINLQLITSAATDFVELISTWQFQDIDRQCDRARVFFVAPLDVAMPLARDPQKKAEGMALYNGIVRAALKKKVLAKVQLPFTVLFIDGMWWLSSDQVHPRTHQLPLLMLRIEDQIRGLHMAKLPPMIDSPPSATTLYYLGQRASARIQDSNRSHDQKIRDMSKLVQHENQTVRTFPQNSRCKQLDEFQLPVQCLALTAPNKGMQDAFEEFKQDTPPGVAKTRPNFTIPRSHVQPVGVFARQLQRLSLRLYKLYPEPLFLKIMGSSVSDIIANSLVAPEANIPFEHIFETAIEWITFDHQVMRLTEAARTKNKKGKSPNTSTPVCDTKFTDITLRDLVMLTILFPTHCSEGPSAFWPETDMITEDQWLTYFTFLDMRTIRYVSHGTTRLSTVKDHKRTSRQRLLAWTRETVTSAGGGICQAQLEYEMGLHITHLASALTLETLTVILGRQSHTPMAMPSEYRESDTSIFNFITHLDGVIFRHHHSGFHTIYTHPPRTWQDGRDDLCNAVTETMKAIGPMTTMYGSLDLALQAARNSYTTSKVRKRVHQSRVIEPLAKVTRTIEQTITSTSCTSDDENQGRRQCTPSSVSPLMTSSISQPTITPPEVRRKRVRSRMNDQQHSDSPAEKRSRTEPLTPPTTSTTSIEDDSRYTEPADDDAPALILPRAPAPTLTTTFQVTTSTGNPDRRVEEIIQLFHHSDTTPTVTLGEGVFGPRVVRNENVGTGNRAMRWREIMSSAGQEEDSDDEGEPMTTDHDQRRNEKTHTITMPRPMELQFVKDKHAWVRETKTHLYRVLDSNGMLMEGTDRERQAHIASFIDKVRGNVIPRICLGCDRVLLEASPVCTCRAIEGLAGFMNIRCFTDQTTQIISSIMVQPRSFSAQQEKLLTMMNTDSWERIFGEQMQFVGLDLEMWICHISLRNKDAINRISDLMQGCNDDAAFMNLSVCVEAGIATAGTTEKHDIIFDKRYRVPVERSHAQLIHPAAHSLLKKILILIDAMIETSEDTRERIDLEDERFKIISAWTTVKRFKGGKSYIKSP